MKTSHTHVSTAVSLSNEIPLSGDRTTDNHMVIIPFCRESWVLCQFSRALALTAPVSQSFQYSFPSCLFTFWSVVMDPYLVTNNDPLQKNISHQLGNASIAHPKTLLFLTVYKKSGDPSGWHISPINLISNDNQSTTTAYCNCRRNFGDR